MRAIVRKKKTKLISSEDEIHLALCEHIRLRGKSNLLWWHTPNGGKRSKREGAKFKKMGVLAGVHDFIFVEYGPKIYTLELKAEDGRPSEEQMTFGSRLNAKGGFSCIVTGLDRAIRVLETWGLVEGRAM